MTLLKLIFVFAKIGLFSFGGGYAMVPMMQKEIVSNGWLTSSQLADMIAIAEMTPGPIAVNTATFVGYRIGGIPGGILATMGVALPSMALILLASGFFYKYNKHPNKIMIFYGIRPVVAGLIVAAALMMAGTALYLPDSIQANATEGGLFRYPIHAVSIGAIAIMAVALFSQLKWKLNPIIAILLGALAGILFYHVL